jgi:hypothetical protein
MNDLIEALNILSKYLNDYGKKFPIACEHDILYVCGIKMDEVTVEDIHRLYDLGFMPGNDDDDYKELYDKEGNYVGEIDLETIDQLTWDMVKNKLSDCFFSYRFGSC